MRAALLTACVLLGASLACADDVEVRLSLEPSTAQPGAEVVLAAEVRVVAGQHIYGLETPFGYPTALTLELPAGLTAVGEASAPAPLFEEIPSVGEVAIYRGSVTFRQTLRVGADAKGPLQVSATLVYQVCDDANTRCTLGEASETLTLGVAAPTAPAPGVADAGPPLGAPLGGLDLGALPGTQEIPPATVRVSAPANLVLQPYRTCSSSLKPVLEESADA